jgi:Golgi transport complex subunit 5
MEVYSQLDFNAQQVANMLISQSKDLQANTAQLSFNIEHHKREIHAHVLEHQELLLDQIKDLDELSQMVQGVDSGAKAVTKSFNR